MCSKVMSFGTAPMAAIANAIECAVSTPLTGLPMSRPKVPATPNARVGGAFTPRLLRQGADVRPQEQAGACGRPKPLHIVRCS